jgi:hypothetical protein
VVKDRERIEKNNTRDTDESHWPPDVEIIIREALEVQPHEQSKEEAKYSRYLNESQESFHMRIRELTSVSCRQST